MGINPEELIQKGEELSNVIKFAAHETLKKVAGIEERQIRIEQMLILLVNQNAAVHSAVIPAGDSWRGTGDDLGGN